MQKTGKISFFAAVLMSINIMVGAGILYAVGPMTAIGDSVISFCWPLIGLLLLPIIWCIARAAQIFPGEGGFYHYCSTGLNPMAGFIAHLGYLLGCLGTAASLITVLRAEFVNKSGLEFFTYYPFAFNFLIVAIYILLNLIAIEKLSKIQSAATLLKITPIVTVIVAILFYFNPNLIFTAPKIQHIGLTVSTVIFSFWGFETCCSLGGLLKDGPKKVASVILTGFFITVALYFFFHLGLLYIMGPNNLATFGAIAFPRFLGFSPAVSSALEIGISCAVLFSWANSILGLSLANITNIHSLANKNLVFGNELLKTLNKNQRPTYSVILHGIILFFLSSSITDINVLFALTNLGLITALGLTLCAVFFANIATKKYTQLGITIIAFASCLVLIYYSLIQIPNIIYVLPLIVSMALGIVMFKIQTSKQTVEASSLITPSMD